MLLTLGLILLTTVPNTSLAASKTATAPITSQSESSTNTLHPNTQNYVNRNMVQDKINVLADMLDSMLKEELSAKEIQDLEVDIKDLEKRILTAEETKAYNELKRLTNKTKISENDARKIRTQFKVLEKRVIVLSEMKAAGDIKAYKNFKTSLKGVHFNKESKLNAREYILGIEKHLLNQHEIVSYEKLKEILDKGKVPAAEKKGYYDGLLEEHKQAQEELKKINESINRTPVPEDSYNKEFIKELNVEYEKMKAQDTDKKIVEADLKSHELNIKQVPRSGPKLLELYKELAKSQEALREIESKAVDQSKQEAARHKVIKIENQIFLTKEEVAQSRRLDKTVLEESFKKLDTAYKVTNKTFSQNVQYYFDRNRSLEKMSELSKQISVLEREITLISDNLNSKNNKLKFGSLLAQSDDLITEYTKERKKIERTVSAIAEIDAKSITKIDAQFIQVLTEEGKRLEKAIDSTAVDKVEKQGISDSLSKIKNGDTLVDLYGDLDKKLNQLIEMKSNKNMTLKEKATFTAEMVELYTLESALDRYKEGYNQNLKSSDLDTREKLGSQLDSLEKQYQAKSSAFHQSSDSKIRDLKLFYYDDISNYKKIERQILFENKNILGDKRAKTTKIVDLQSLAKNAKDLHEILDTRVQKQLQSAKEKSLLKEYRERKTKARLESKAQAKAIRKI